MRVKSDINVTPLIDVVLVLLIIFIVMVPGLSKALTVVVPQIIKKERADNQQSPSLPVVIEVEPDTNNRQYLFKLQSQPLPLGQLAPALSPVLQRQPVGFRKVFLKLDEDVPYQVAVNVLDQIRVASEQAKRETLTRLGSDGGDTKVVTSLKKRAG